MEELKQELNWLEEEKLRLRSRYMEERSEGKSKIIMTKLMGIMEMAGDVRYGLFRMERGF